MFGELKQLETLLEQAPANARINQEASVSHKKKNFPIYSINFEEAPANAPVVTFVAGVHGLERIGTRVLLAFMETCFQLAEWDELFQQSLKKCRIHFYPLVNPIGMARQWRSNGNGIDLMRNAPVDAEDLPAIKWLAGHRISPKLPWYRGAEGESMETESKALCDYIQKINAETNCALSVDVHSGFGAVDRLWFPYAKSRQPIAHAAECVSFKKLLDRTLPNHVYAFEPQSQQYTTHGDLWDHLYDLNRKESPQKLFIPFSLEMGSWMWVKKNPRQLFSMLGAFNPILPHRRKRILRRHLPLFDFFIRATISHAKWAVTNEDERASLISIAKEHWYAQSASSQQ